MAINFRNNPLRLGMRPLFNHSFIEQTFIDVSVTELCSGDKIVDKETRFPPLS